MFLDVPQITLILVTIQKGSFKRLDLILVNVLRCSSNNIDISDYSKRAIQIIRDTLWEGINKVSLELLLLFSILFLKDLADS